MGPFWHLWPLHFLYFDIFQPASNLAVLFWRHVGLLSFQASTAEQACMSSLTMFKITGEQ